MALENLVAGFRSGIYAIDKRKITLPQHIVDVMPDELRVAMEKLWGRTVIAIRNLVELEGYFHKRYYRACPTDDSQRYRRHLISINRLLRWREFTDRDRTLFPTAKIPACVVHFHVTEEAYLRYSRTYRTVRAAYVTGPYQLYRTAGDNFRSTLARAAMPQDHRVYYLEWWTRYNEEMGPWESRLHELVLPSWNKFVEELTDLIQQRVDVDAEWEN
ncbi:hypothetical protein FQN57_005001 [Myotisia sp. PD_48]|nr:hypothetical protein FQN57_005001 [Myotisia sp. PD_48]